MTSLISRARLATKSDAVLVALARQGSEAAFTAIVDRHRRALQRHCRSLLPAHQVDDAVQLTFLRAFQALRCGTDVRELAPWLHRIARNVAFTELSARTAAEHSVLDEEPEDRRGSEVVEHRQELRAALGAVAALPERQRAAVIRAVGGASHATIARELGVSEVAARQILHRARTVLRAAVQALTPPPVMWLARRISALSDRLPTPPPGLDPILPKLATVVAAAALVATPTLRHVGESVLGLRHDPPHARQVSVRRVGPDTAASAAEHSTATQVALVTGDRPPHPGSSTASAIAPAPRHASGVASGHDGHARAAAAPGSSGAVSGSHAWATTAGPSSPQSSAGASSGNSDPSTGNSDPSATDASVSDPSSSGSPNTDPTVSAPTSTDQTSTDSTPSTSAPTNSDPASTGSSTTDTASATSTDPTSTAINSTDPSSSSSTSTDPTATSGP